MSHILDRNTVVLVVKLIASESYIVFRIARRGRIDLLTVFPESPSALELFNQMISVGSFSFASLLELYREDRVITEKDMVHFSNDQMFSLLRIVLAELVKRKTVKDFVTDKIRHSKELLEDFFEKSTEEFRKEVNDALEELRLANEQDALEVLEEFPLEESQGSYFGLKESEVF
jgi:hypothetical protein